MSQSRADILRHFRDRPEDPRQRKSTTPPMGSMRGVAMPDVDTASPGWGEVRDIDSWGTAVGKNDSILENDPFPAQFVTEAQFTPAQRMRIQWIPSIKRESIKRESIERESMLHPKDKWMHAAMLASGAQHPHRVLILQNEENELAKEEKENTDNKKFDSFFAQSMRWLRSSPFHQHWETINADQLRKRGLRFSDHAVPSPQSPSSSSFFFMNPRHPQTPLTPEQETQLEDFLRAWMQDKYQFVSVHTPPTDMLRTGKELVLFPPSVTAAAFNRSDPHHSPNLHIWHQELLRRPQVRTVICAHPEEGQGWSDTVWGALANLESGEHVVVSLRIEGGTTAGSSSDLAHAIQTVMVAQPDDLVDMFDYDPPMLHIAVRRRTTGSFAKEVLRGRFWEFLLRQHGIVAHFQRRTRQRPCLGPMPAEAEKEATTVAEEEEKTSRHNARILQCRKRWLDRIHPTTMTRADEEKAETETEKKSKVEQKTKSEKTKKTEKKTEKKNITRRRKSTTTMEDVAVKET